MDVTARRWRSAGRTREIDAAVVLSDVVLSDVVLSDVVLSDVVLFVKSSMT